MGAVKCLWLDREPANAYLDKQFWACTRLLLPLPDLVAFYHPLFASGSIRSKCKKHGAPLERLAPSQWLRTWGLLQWAFIAAYLGLFWQFFLCFFKRKICVFVQLKTNDQFQIILGSQSFFTIFIIKLCLICLRRCSRNMLNMFKKKKRNGHELYMFVCITIK